MKRSFLTLTFLMSLFLNSLVSADIIDNGRYTTDTATGLDWLDVTASLNKSYNEVIEQFGPNGEFSGYRYATATEFNTLVNLRSG